MNLCDTCKLSDCEPTECEQSIRKDERERVLDELVNFIDLHDNLYETGTHGKAILIHDLVDKIEELRGEQE